MHQKEFEEIVYEPPEEVGIDAPALVQKYLDAIYEVTYSLPSCRRLLKEAGLRNQKPCRTAVEDDEEGFRLRPTVELSGQRDWTCLLGAITEDGARFFS